MDQDADTILKNLSIHGPKTLDPMVVNQYGARQSAKDVMCYQCLFVIRCIDMLLLQRNRDMRIGFVGCGQVGQAILNALLESGFPGERMLVNTRMPEKLSALQSKGVSCSKECTNVLAAADVIILCIPPAQLMPVASAIRGKIKKRTTLISTIIGATETKLRQVFGVRKAMRCVVDMPSLISLGPPPVIRDDSNEHAKKRAIEYSDTVLDIAMVSMAQGSSTTSPPDPEEILPGEGEVTADQEDFVDDDEDYENFEERFAKKYAPGTKFMIRTMQSLAMQVLGWTPKQACRAAEYVVLDIRRKTLYVVDEEENEDENGPENEGREGDDKKKKKKAIVYRMHHDGTVSVEKRRKRGKKALKMKKKDNVDDGTLPSIVSGHQWVHYASPTNNNEMMDGGAAASSGVVLDERTGKPQKLKTSCWLPFVEELASAFQQVMKDDQIEGKSPTATPGATPGTPSGGKTRMLQAGGTPSPAQRTRKL